MNRENLANQQRARQYLLGRLSPEDRQEFEEHYFADLTAFEEVVAAESDLIDSCARGELAHSEQQEFERRYRSSPEWLGRIAFAMALGEIVRRHRANREADAAGSTAPLWRRFRLPALSLQWALGAACIGLAVLLFVARIQNGELSRDLREATESEAKLRSQRDTAIGQLAKKTQTIDQHPDDQTKQTGVPDLVFKLIASITRREADEKPRSEMILLVPTDRPWIKLQMPIEEDTFRWYEAVLNTPEMREVGRGKGLRSQSSHNGIEVDWRIRSDSLPNGSYILELKGRQDGSEPELVSAYSFRVIHK
jgi:hypothetical protein